MGCCSSRKNDSNNEENCIEVYLLLKTRYHNSYTSNTQAYEPILLFKCSDEQFYYTDVVLEKTTRLCQLSFGKYQFLPMPVYYKPIGRTHRKLNDIKKWVNTNKKAWKIHLFLLIAESDYLRECTEFLEIFDFPGENQSASQSYDSIIRQILYFSSSIRCASSINDIHL